MTYSHTTNHSIEPKIEFWRAMENLFKSFPYWTGHNKYHSKHELISFFEIETKESFNVSDDVDIYEN